MNNIKIFGFLFGLFFCLIVSACSNGSGGDASNTINLETQAQSITSLGEFPVGIADYTPAVIKITNPSATAIITSKELAEKNWRLVVEGEIEPPKVGNKYIEIARIYVNWELVDEGKGDTIQYEGDKIKFSKSIPVTNDDLRKIYFPIVVAVVDVKHYVVGERSGVILQDGDPNPIGAYLKNAVYVHGNNDFIKNAIAMALSSIDGQNLAPYLPRIQWTLPPIAEPEDPQITFLDISPRAFLLQGIQVMNYRVEGNPNQYNIIPDIRIKNLVIEYSNNRSLRQKGRNYVNMRAKNVDIKDGFVISLIKDSTQESGYYAVLTTSATIHFEYADGGAGNLDTPFFTLIGSVLDFIQAFFQAIFHIDMSNPIRINLGMKVLDALIKQIVKSDQTQTYAIHDLILTNDEINFIADNRFTTSTIKMTYATPGNNGNPDMSLKGTNSTIAFSDDFVNQILAVYLTGEKSDIPIQDLGAYIEQLKGGLGLTGSDIDIWKWLMDANGGIYPPLNIHLIIKTPPILELDSTGKTLGTLHMRDTYLEIQEVDKNGNPIQLLAKLTIDMDMQAKWERNRIVLSLNKGTDNYTLLFNKLYPLFLPAEIKQIPDVVANALNEIFEKVGIVGYATQEGFSTGGCLAIHGDLTTQRDLSKMVAHAYNKDAWNTPTYLACVVTSTGVNGLPVSFMDITSSRLQNPETANIAIVTENGIEYKADDTQLTWDDGLAFTFTAPQNHLISHISFRPRIAFTGFIGDTLDFFEEVSLLCVIHESLIGGGVQKSGNPSEPSIVPKGSTAMPLEIEFNDLAEKNITQMDAFNWKGEAQGLVEYDLPFCKEVGIGLKFRKSPFLPLERTIIMDALAEDIVVDTVDLNLKPMSFGK